MQKLFRGVSIARMIRLILGMMALVQGFISKDVLLIVAGSVLVTMAVFNAGCPGGSCMIAAAKDTQSNP